MGFSSEPGGRGSPLSEINVTPLVDVMLVLLIIFMVAAPMMTIGVPVDLPDAEAPTLDVDDESLIVSVAADGTISLGDEELSLDALEARLNSDAALRERDEIYVRADEAVVYRHVVQVLAVIRAAGIGKMGLVTEAPEPTAP